MNTKTISLTMFAALKEKILSKKAKIAVIGLGYVGLPLAVEFAKKGFFVLGIDTDLDRIKKVKKFVPYILDVSIRDIKKVVRGKRLLPMHSFTSLKDTDVVIICVPTPLKRKYQPDVSYIVCAVKEIAQHLHRGQLVILESTTYPGTTEEVIKPLLEKSGLICGKDFYLAFSPERIDPANKKHPLRKIPKVVGGITKNAAVLVKYLYGYIIEKVVLVSSARVAESVKLLENTFRLVNIGLINEMAMMAHKMDINIWEIIEAAKTKPFGFMAFYPGPGVGGHCLDKNEKIFVKERNSLKVMLMPDFIKYIQKARDNDVEVLSFDPIKRKSVFRKIVAASARPYSGRMFDISTEDGRHLKVTDLHPMFIYKNNTWHLKYAKDLKKGDNLPVCSGLPWIETPYGKDIKIKKLDRFAMVKIKSILPTRGDWVYSIETEKPHTFVTSYGIVVHNCIPKDPLYLYWKAKLHGFKSRFIKLASDLNSSMPQYIVQRVEKILQHKNKKLDKAKILVIGATYKKDVKDLRKSPAIELIDILQRQGMEVSFHDPLIPYLRINNINLKSESLSKELLYQTDCVIISTDHSSINYDFLVRHAKLIFDTRNVLKGIKANNIIRL